MKKNELEALAGRVEVVAIQRAKLFVSTNHFVSGKDADIHAAASGFAVAAALRSLATNPLEQAGMDRENCDG